MRAVEREQCPSCLQLYAYELETRCYDCDSAFCPFCVTRVRAAWSCSGCMEGADGR